MYTNVPAWHMFGFSLKKIVELKEAVDFSALVYRRLPVNLISDIKHPISAESTN